ncbi:CypX Cytochrome P450 [Pyrenophora tritici-repentis]|uniref:Cytochrome P450 n=2 Tax=Pyrenophora tritici-repentis TaxID=45151 RepID=A0A922NLJ9_9PLEO|nr:CypX Cytochrome P450 [Pyrenophora tritici-repentis]KAI0577640.1 CypX Cytochrome P450 [Pyrenophora tritici-repentis]KAI0591612.1 CypX cytochrome P450 [Pyrenophora tritici-repentis]KAI0613930.1 CypX Cytochrome P450 [Pyrenophora tritici-repentis]KAI0626182.1 CypX Cytochrome P450 [Pyrenophora tritici-repentis]
MAIVLIISLISIPFLVIQPLFKLFCNYTTAQKSGLRIIVSPLPPFSFQWQLAAHLFRPLLQQWQWFRAIDWTCCWHDNDALHQELGLCFIVVSPGHNVLCTSDPRSIDHVLKKWRDFVKPDNVNEILGTFGQNVDTSNGDDWIRHRKLTAPCFNERASATVWREALQQSNAMLDQWLLSAGEKQNSMIQDTSTLALNVISSVAFENNEVNKPTSGHTLSLRDALVTVMSTSISPAMEGIIPLLRLPPLETFLPKSVKQLLVAMTEFRQYMDEIVAKEKKRPRTEGTKGPNLISSLVNANDEVKTEAGKPKSRLSNGELRGNIFIFTVGGLESTSNTLSYALALLAVHPEVQTWLVEELDEVVKDCPDGDMDYATAFPRLKRTMAVMYETLRLYGPSPPIPRSPFPENSNQVIPVSVPKSEGSTTHFTLPPNTQLMLNSWASHTSPAHFCDPLVWDPKRWIQTHGVNSNGPVSAAGLTAEELKHPGSGSGFFAWGTGPRVCPGMKFSQVEFCGALSSVLRRVRVEAVGQGGKDNIMSVLRDSHAEPLLLHVRQPEKLELRILQR